MAFEYATVWRPFEMFKVFIFFLIFIAGLTENAYAYLDFGTGSYILQILAASFVGIAVVMRNHLEWVKNLFRRKKRETDEDDTEE